LLRPGDLVVLNDSRVLPARVMAHKESGGRVELLFLHPLGPAEMDSGELWEALARPSSRLRAGMRLSLGQDDAVELVAPVADGRWQVRGPVGTPLVALMERHGHLPLPPYIKEPLADPAEYQTVYAREPGSAAAPTAGLHFTPGLLARLEERGVEMARVTLHVGLDTFRPITEDTVEAHVIHREAYSVTRESVAQIDAARREGRRVVAVGTTSVRVLETLYAGSSPEKGATGALSGSTGVFITPGYQFRAVDALVTNFHLPHSSLLALVMAFAGVEAIRTAYACAVQAGYRFFSFGDAMLMDCRVGGAR
jgi:S-adenosylmethionine:tRNA ribosyltransferase-isomerase